ncbi:hypothetical protein D915_008480 [Fasciola hepatica]|uniref:Uncharacterized protein n=1 Tax=Fasciola hepatica TaxID=6192 RepID=A0A4E0RUA3_FASHE|nr:hypothetical protein D915_008480 [Fasciola hepatica]
MDGESNSTTEARSIQNYRSIPYKERNDFIRYAIKSVLFSHFHHNRENVGFLTERQSLWVLITSGLSDACADHGLAFVNFRGIHTLVFNPLAAGRLRISTDCYVDFFLPRFSVELSKVTKSDQFDLKHVQSLLLNQVWISSTKDHCGLRDKLIITSIMTNRQLFGIAGSSSGQMSNTDKSFGNL